MCNIQPEPLEIGPDGWPVDLDLIDPPQADCRCRDLRDPWRDALGRWRCGECDPPPRPDLAHLTASLRAARATAGLPPRPDWLDLRGLLLGSPTHQKRPLAPRRNPTPSNQTRPKPARGRAAAR